MTPRGYILILCLCFIALVSVMVLSSLTMSQISLKMSQRSQQQLQTTLLARLRHWQQLDERQLALQQRQPLPSCPAQYAVWISPQLACEQARVTSAAEPELETLAWSSLVIRQHLQLPLRRGQR
jgi:hypothetical protein